MGNYKVFNNKKNLFFFTVLIFLNIILFSNQKNYKFEHISLKDGLSQVSVYSILQDKHGFMWFGTFDGLNRYDGKDFVIFKHDPDDKNSLSRSIIWSLLEDSDGDLWIGTIRGGLNKYNRITETFISYKNIKGNNESISDNSIISLYEDKEKNIWVGTLKGLNLFDKKNEKFKHIIDNKNKINRNNDRINDIIEDDNSNIWIGSDTGLSKFNKKTGNFIYYNKFSKNINIEQNFVSSFFIDNSGILWIGTRASGLFMYDKKTNNIISINIFNENNDKSYAEIFKIIEVNNKELWITTAGDGLKILNLNDRSFKEVKPVGNIPDSINSNVLDDIFISKNGLIWVSSNTSGINVFNPQRTKFFHNKIEIKNIDNNSINFIQGFIETDKNTLWIGTNSGLLKYNSLNDKYSLFNTEMSLSKDIQSGRIRKILIDKAGVFWIGQINGLYTFDKKNEKFLKFKLPGSYLLDNTRILNIYEDSREQLWVSFFEEGLVRLNKERDKIERFKFEYEKKKSIGSNQIYDIVEDKSGTLWFATIEGLIGYDTETKKFKNYKNIPGNKNSLNSNTALSLFNDKNDVLWVGTMRGFSKFNKKNEIFTRYTSKEGYINSPVYEIIGDNDNKLWLASINLSRFDPESENFVFFNSKDGVQDGEFNGDAVLKSKYKKNTIYFGGSNGYNIVDTGKIIKNLNEPKIVFTNIKINGEELKPLNNPYLKTSIIDTDSIELPYKLNNIMLRFISLDYTNPETNKYSYKIKDINEDWIFLGNNNEIVLTNLNPGIYNINVKGSNNNGVWNKKGAQLRITIMPPFWLTFWFKTIILLIIIIVLIIFILRIKNKIELKYIKIDSIKEFYIKNNISNREREVIELIVKGKSNKEIEELLFISIKTVNNHKYNIYKKLKINNNGELKNLYNSTGTGLKT